MTLRSSALAFIRGVREIFTLGTATDRAARLGEPVLARVRESAEASRRRLRASRTLADPIVAIELLVAARQHAQVAVISAGGAAQELSSVPPIDALPFDEAERMRAELDDEVRALLGAVDTRSLVALRGLRFGRAFAVAVAIIAITTASIAARIRPVDIALGKAVTTSPLKSESPTPDHVVDGITRGTFAVHTNEAENAFISIDLTTEYRIRRVRVFNRGDGWFDDILPLSVEVSNDGTQWSTLATRTEHFEIWTVDTDKRARFVRVIKPERGYIALNEIEVFGEP